jgi:transcriptional regulator with XRE-family HTH domain
METAEKPKELNLYNMKWNERLKLAREKRGLNKSQMSRLVGVSKATTTYWESGSTKMIDGEHLVKVASVLKITPEWLIGGTDELPEWFAYGDGQIMPSAAPLPHAAGTAFQTWLKLELDRRHLSQAELARMSGVPQPTIQRIISGETGDPRGSTMAKLREILRAQSATKDVVSTESYADIKQIRRTNMLQLIKQERTRAAFAHRVGTDPAYVSQIFSDKTRAEIGDTLSRNIEKAYELEHGWMDNIHEIPHAAEMPDGHLDRPFDQKRVQGAKPLENAKENRLLNLRYLINTRFGGNTTACAKALGLKPPQLQRWITANEAVRQGISEDSARAMESKLGLHPKSLDAEEGAEKAALATDESELLEAWAYLLPAEKEAITEQIRPMAAHNKAVLEHYSKLATDK